MVSLQSELMLLFRSFRLNCGSPAFAAFKQRSPDNSQLDLYMCKSCPTFHISLSANAVLLDRIVNASNVDQCFPASDTNDLGNCPFGISDCTTFVNVTSGFWTTFSTSARNKLEKVKRCPRGYCGCNNPFDGTCLLAPEYSVDRDPNSLCNGHRTGILCGGCLPDYTQSIDGASCVSNEDCVSNLWWVWTLSVVGFAFLGLLILPLRAHSSGSWSCVLFYFQMASFATNRDDSNRTNAILDISIVRSALAFYASACYAPNMSAFDATATRLVGSLFVLVFSMVWTWALSALQPRLQERNISIQVSFSGSFVTAILFVFSSVASVVFTLVECTSYASDGSGVLFIDGTVRCLGARWGILIVVVVLLCLFPVIFAVALWKDKLPASARAALCRPYTERTFYWGAITLVFRLLISLLQFLQVEFPNLLAFMRGSVSSCMLGLLIFFSPYKHDRAFWLDVVCHVCLILQFGLQALEESGAYFGITLDADSSEMRFFRSLSILSLVLR
jgi:hypothetical protein